MEDSSKSNSMCMASKGDLCLESVWEASKVWQQQVQT